MRWLFLSVLFLGFTQIAFSMGPKIPKAMVNFHIEGSKNDNPKMIFPFQAPDGTKYFRRIPVAPTSDIVHFRPFPADDGSIGAVFQLSRRGANRLAALTTQSQGKWMIAVINGRPTDVVFVDKPVRDGILVVWKGMQQRDVDVIDLQIPREGMEKKERAALKKAAKARLKRTLKTEKKRKS